MLIRSLLIIVILTYPRFVGAHQLKLWVYHQDRLIGSSNAQQVLQWASLAKPVTYFIFLNELTKHGSSIDSVNFCNSFTHPINAAFLLEHQSNLPSLTENIFNRKKLERAIENISVIKQQKGTPNYSNLNFILIGRELECLTKQPFTQLRSHYWQRWTHAKIDQEFSTSRPFPKELAASGNLYTTPLALVNFAKHFLACLNGNPCILSPFSLNQCELNTYCNGFYYQMIDNYKVYQHKGKLDQLETLLIIVPSLQAVILLNLTNKKNKTMLTKETSLLLLKYIFNDILVNNNFDN